MGARAGVSGTPVVRAALAAGLLALHVAAAAGQEETPPEATPPEATPILPDLLYPDPWVVARWERADLLLSGALALGELLADLPHLSTVRFGFLEGPQALTCCGAGPGAVEYTVDGYRIVPQGAGAVEPLSIPIAELESVTVRRAAAGYRVDLATRRLRGGVPYSTIEGGTGDYNVTLLRGLFLGPFLGGAVGFAFDRVETGGFRDLGASERVGVWVSYAHRLPLGFAGAVQWRRSGVGRASLEAPERSDVIARLRRRFGESWTVDLSAARAQTTIDSVPGGPRPTPRPEAAAGALQVAFHEPALQAALRVEGWNGDAVPDWAAALEAGWRPAPWLAVGGDARRSRWGARDFDEGAARLRLRAARALALGLDLEAGTHRPPGLEAIPPLRYRRGTAAVEVRLAGVEVEGAVGRWRATPSLPLGLPFDLGATPLAGGEVTAWRVAGRVPTPLPPLRVVGAYERRGDGAFLYWPVDRLSLGGLFHGHYLEGQLEVRARFDLLLRGPMRSFGLGTGAPALELRPRRLGSAGEVIVRVKDVRVFWTFEGFRDPAEAADVGGALMPQARTTFGLKWEFWN